MPHIQIVLNANDLSRVRLLSSPDPLEEMAFAAHRLPLLRADPVLGGWARRTVRSLGVTGRDVLGVLDSAFVQVSGLGHEDPANPRTFDESIETIRSLPRSHWGAELEGLTKLGVRTDLVRGLVDTGSDAIKHLESALRAFHSAAIAPHWSQIQTYSAAGRHSATIRMAEGGVEELLKHLHPTITWQAPVLTMSAGGGCPPGCVHQKMQTAGTQTLTFVADGRGLILVPSIFSPVTSLRVPGPDEDEPLIIAFPVQTEWHLFVGGRESNIRNPLADLMGSTRALVLEALSEGQFTTSNLARRVGISVASASEHTGILRAAKMISSTREGNRVIHRLSALGDALMRSTSQTAFSAHLG